MAPPSKSSAQWLGLILKESQARSFAEDPPLPPPGDVEVLVDDRRTGERRSEDVERALTKRELELVRDELDELRGKYEALAKDRDRALLWGIGVLGGVVLAMFSWIFNFFVGKGH